jgi:hypothetical protein
VAGGEEGFEVADERGGSHDGERYGGFVFPLGFSLSTFSILEGAMFLC